MFISKLLQWFLISILVAMLSACRNSSEPVYSDASSSGNGGGNDYKTLKVLSPKDGQNVEYSFVTIEIASNSDIFNIKAKNLSLLNSFEKEGIKNGDKFYIFNVPLTKDENKIKLTLTKNSGVTESKELILSSEEKGLPPIGLNSDRKEGFEKLDTIIKVGTSLNSSEYLLDKEGNGIIDEKKSDGSFDVSYTKEGRFAPIVTIRTSDGILYTTQKNAITIDLKPKPLIQPLSSLTNINVIDMQIFDHNKYFVLSDDNIYEINATSNQISKTISLLGLSNPEGFFVAIDGDVFIADTGADRVVKLSKDSNYQQTMVFGTNGSGNGKFNQPKDIVVGTQGDLQKIYVLDSGNNRVQVFNYVGAWLYSFDGSNTPTGKLNNPTSMVGYFAQPLTIVDSGNGIIRTLQCSINQPAHEVSVIKDGISSSIGKITLNGSLIVPDKGNKKIHFFQNNHWLKKSIDAIKVPNIVISHDYLSLMVSNEGESGLSKIKIQIDPKGADPIDIVKEIVNE